MRKVVLVDGARLPIGKFGGSLKGFSASDMAGMVIKEAVKRAGIKPEDVDQMIIGQVGEIDEDGFIGRVAGLKGGLPITTIMSAVNRQCASGLQAISDAVLNIQTGRADIIVAAGTESLSNLPYYQFDSRWGSKMGDKNFKDGVISILTWPIDGSHNGVSAEKVAQTYKVSRQEQDEYAARSQELAAEAVESGRFDDEVLAVELKDRKGNVTVFDRDEGYRKGTTVEKLAKLRPAFVKDGTVTAGNSSTLNDGAAALVVMAEEKALELGLEPICEIVDFEIAGNEPELFGYAPKYSTENLLKRQNLSVDDIDMYEINEAFASQTVAVARDLNLDMDRVNIYGGGISVGHPIGATGAVLAVKSLYEFKKTDKKRILVTMCIGGGQGMSMLFERYSK